MSKKGSASTSTKRGPLASALTDARPRALNPRVLARAGPAAVEIAPHVHHSTGSGNLASVTHDDEPIEHDLIRTGTAVEFEVVETKVEPTVGDEDSHVRIVLRMPEDDVETFSFGLIYTIGVLSFHDGRPRGVSGRWFEDDDQWSAADMLRGLQFVRGRLHWHADYVRGRCIKTTVEISRDGTVLVETVNRGEAATRWVDRLEGKKYLQAVE
ncbi:MAG: hypothetical protein IPH07_18390 [Deltaproteobacteria bacterium]|nr:hypothetical protein [Deltaproteobacteria bacterium]MBK8715671.1 hypothetical protein [Deltaproteobacteria bacterium]